MRDSQERGTSRSVVNSFVLRPGCMRILLAAAAGGVSSPPQESQSSTHSPREAEQQPHYLSPPNTLCARLCARISVPAWQESQVPFSPAALDTPQRPRPACVRAVRLPCVSIQEEQLGLCFAVRCCNIYVLSRSKAAGARGRAPGGMRTGHPRQLLAAEGRHPRGAAVAREMGRHAQIPRPNCVHGVQLFSLGCQISCTLVALLGKRSRKTLHSLTCVAP